MELADLISTSLNKAQSASNALIANQPDKAEKALESLCEFLNEELLKPAIVYPAEQAAAETPAGGQPEKSQEQVQAEAPGGDANEVQQDAKQPEQVVTHSDPEKVNAEQPTIQEQPKAHSVRSEDQK